MATDFSFFGGAAPAASADTIPAEAITVNTSLGISVQRMDYYRPEKFAEHLKDLDRIRDLVAKVGETQDLHTPAVAVALANLKRAAVKMAEAAPADMPYSKKIDQLVQDMREVRAAGKNLQQQLPGDVSWSIGNETRGATQVNASVGKTPSEGRVTSESIGNKAINGGQVNAPMYGDIAALAQFMAMATPVGAKC